MKIVIDNYRAKSRNQTITSHWRNYQKHRDELASLMNPYIKREMFKTPVTVTIEVYYKGKRHVDTSNIDDKIIVDGLMKCGVIKNDTAYENPEVIKRCYPESGEDKLVVTVEPKTPIDKSLVQ